MIFTLITSVIAILGPLEKICCHLDQKKKKNCSEIVGRKSWSEIFGRNICSHYLTVIVSFKILDFKFIVDVVAILKIL